MRLRYTPHTPNMHTTVTSRIFHWNVRRSPDDTPLYIRNPPPRVIRCTDGIGKNFFCVAVSEFFGLYIPRIDSFKLLLAQADLQTLWELLLHPLSKHQLHLQHGYLHKRTGGCLLFHLPSPSLFPLPQAPRFDCKAWANNGDQESQTPVGRGLTASCCDFDQ